MTNFICKVMTPQGQIVKIKIEENDKISCLKKLKKNGMTPISIEPSILIPLNNKNKKKLTATIHSKKKKKIEFKKSIFTEEIFNKVSIEEIKEFTADFYILKKSNFTNKHALTTIINKTENAYFKEVLKNILDGVEHGKHIYKTMKEYKDVFPFVYINLIKTGELTNSFDDSLAYAITYLEDEEKLKTKVKNILLPNVFAFLGILLMLFFAIIIVIPNLQNIFQTYGINVYLPKFALILSKIFRVILKYWYVIFVFIGIIISIFIKFISDDDGRYKFDRFKYRNIIFGRLVFLLDFSRVFRSIFLNVQNKMRFEDALEISKNVTKNTYMINLIEKSINNVYIGKPWSDVFENERMLNPIILELLKKGTKSKSVLAAESTIKYIDKEIEKEIDRVLKILPEISYIAVGIALLIFVITILIPCMQIYLGGFLFI